MSEVSRIEVIELLESTIGVGIELSQYTETKRIQPFAKPVPLAMVERLANSVFAGSIGQTVRMVRAFSPTNSLIGEWAFNEKQAQENAQRQIEGKSPKAFLTPEQKQANKAAVKSKQAAKERELCAKAPKALLLGFTFYRDAKTGEKREITENRGRAIIVPFVPSDSKVGLYLTDRDGYQAVVPIYNSLYNSAVNRGKTAAKENPDIDPLKYVKRLMAEVLLESTSTRTNQTGRYWVSATIHKVGKDESDLTLTRIEAVKVQKKLARDEYKRKVRAVMKKGATPFGKNCKWIGRAKQDRVEFSRG